jgi:hypothetical protein
VKFTLGGGSSTPKTNHTSPAATPAFDPPAAAPPERRTFSRSSTGFAIAPDLLLTTAAEVKGARRIVVEFPNGTPVDATVERIGDDGLALLKISDKKLNYLNLANDFSGGAVHCMAFPDVGVFGIAVETLSGNATAPREDGWKISLSKHPRLPGAPLVDQAGNLVGIETSDRDDAPAHLPALSLARIKAFLANDLPGQPCANSRAAAVVQITAAFER